MLTFYIYDPSNEIEMTSSKKIMKFNIQQYNVEV